jgi:hypothetical protein
MDQAKKNGKKGRKRRTEEARASAEDDDDRLHPSGASEAAATPTGATMKKHKKAHQGSAGERIICTRRWVQVHL